MVGGGPTADEPAVSDARWLHQLAVQQLAHPRMDDVPPNTPTSPVVLQGHRVLQTTNVPQPNVPPTDASETQRNQGLVESDANEPSGKRHVATLPAQHPARPLIGCHVRTRLPGVVPSTRRKGRVSAVMWPQARSRWVGWPVWVAMSSKSLSRCKTVRPTSSAVAAMMRSGMEGARC